MPHGAVQGHHLRFESCAFPVVRNCLWPQYRRNPTRRRVPAARRFLDRHQAISAGKPRARMATDPHSRPPAHPPISLDGMASAQAVAGRTRAALRACATRHAKPFAGSVLPSAGAKQAGFLAFGLGSAPHALMGEIPHARFENQCGPPNLMPLNTHPESAMKIPIAEDGQAISRPAEPRAERPSGARK